MSESDHRTRLVASARRIVVKTGTNVLCDDRGLLEPDRVEQIARGVQEIRRDGREVLLVSSGSVGAGMGELNLSKRPDTLPELQAAAAVGQGVLMRHYHDAFRRMGVAAAQALLTRDDFEGRGRYLNARNTLRAILKYGAVPVINENDTTSIEELRWGDNDMLSALVTNLMQAQLLIILTTVPGLLRRGGDDVVGLVEEIDDDVLALDTGERSARGSGGMASKLEAARVALDAGEPVVIADGTREDILAEIMSGADVGTLFVPKPNRMAGRKRWIGFGARSRGSICIDAGAATALTKRGKSLLAAGVVRVEGTFVHGDVVNVLDEEGRRIARGLVNYASDEVERIKGLKTSAIAAVLGAVPYDEIIHRDHMVVFS